jgi:transcription termination factor Rho
MKEVDQLDNERNDLLKKQNKINYDSRKWLDQSRSKHSNVSPSFPIKKSVLDKKKRTVTMTQRLWMTSQRRESGLD